MFIFFVLNLKKVALKLNKFSVNMDTIINVKLFEFVEMCFQNLPKIQVRKQLVFAIGIALSTLTSFWIGNELSIDWTLPRIGLSEQSPTLNQI